MNEVLSLITETHKTDESGDGAKEFYQAAATGLKPEIKFVLTDYLDYEGEKLVRYEDGVYHVLRTYRNGQELELTCYSEVNPS